MSLDGKKVLVTGAGGFIGSHLVEKLVKHGAKVKAFVKYNSRNDWGMLELLDKEIQNSIEIIAGDLRDYNAMSSACKDVDIIFHLGALIAIPYSYIHPRETVETNVLGTLNVLMAAKENNIGKVVHTSTSEVYGTAKYIPIDEKHPLQAQSPYSASKISADKIAESFYLSYNVPIAIIRPFNTYGPRQSARAVIPTIITQVLTEKKLKLGSTYPIRDFTYVDDIVNGFIKGAETEKSAGEVINLGTGRGIAIGELANKIISLCGKNIKIETEEKRLRPEKSEISKLVADSSKAKKLLNWEPKTSLEKGLKKTIHWFSKNINLYKPELYVL